MIHSVLVDKLNKYLFLQCIFCFLPVILIGVYVTAYMADINRVIGVITYNDRITKQNMADGVLKEVVDYKENSDGSFDLAITGGTSCELDVALGDPIYYVYVIDAEWFQLVTAGSEGYTYSTVCNFVDEIKDTNSGVEYKKGDITCSLDSGSLLATVILNKDGNYTIEYSDDSIDDEVVDSLKTLEVELATDTGYRFKFHDGYDLSIKDMDVNFCSNLPTNNIYYNETNKVFVRNISEDFPKNFILGSNMLVVIVSAVFYCILLWMVRARKELVLLSGKAPIICNISALMLLPLCILATFVLF